MPLDSPMDWLSAAHRTVDLREPDLSLRYAASPAERSKRSAWLDLATGTAVAQIVVWESGECETHVQAAGQVSRIETRFVSSLTELLPIVRGLIQECRDLGAEHERT